MIRIRQKRTISGLVLLALILSSAAGFLATGGVSAEHTPQPESVTIASSFQSELGCPGDWQPDCAASSLAYDAGDGVWQGTFDLPMGEWEYKAALNNSWDENYGLNAQTGGTNIPLSLGAPNSVKFYYDHSTHWVTDNVNAIIATVPGSFQDEIGCPGDWQPDCLRSWLQDPDGDGQYSFSTDQIPAGGYEAKIAIGESWDENYGAGGAPNGANIAFSVPVEGSTVAFQYDPVSHLLDITVSPPAGHHPDNNVEYFGLGHNSQDGLYRVPFGAITPGTELILRFRTYHNDVTQVQARFWDSADGQEFFQEMEPVARDVSCYDPGQPEETCDFWETNYTPDRPNTLYYRFIVRDGTATAYYDDDAFQDGGWGEATPELQDDSYAVTVYDPAFQSIDWLKDGVVYQIFPDRFRNGRSNNDPSSDEPRYGYPPNEEDQILLKEWGELPEGYCRSYVDPAEPCDEGPRGRDYFGGDLRGVIQRLNYLEELGVTVIYFNPIFEAGSNHAYDTQDYYQIDHFFGDNKEFGELVKQAEKRGIQVVVDGVFNHVSSDSPYFDRYGHFESLGACESPDSPYRSWFYFRPVEPGTGVCAGEDGTPNAANYDSWFGFDSLPVLNKSNPEVIDLVYGAEEAVGRYWINQGAAGWRLDVMGDPSFPPGFWQEFRQAVKETRPDAPIVGELWKKHEVLAHNRGETADTAMNYRFRNAILGFFGRIDDKGFVDDGQTDQPPSLFARKLNSIREDNPDATYYTLFNLMDSHDTERILWSLTPGRDNRQEKEFDLANLARGKELLKVAAVVQMTVPGAPTIYYGDEVGVTGDDDPDDRRTFPWEGDGEFGHAGDQELLDHYQMLTDLRAGHPVFRDGALSFLLTDDADRTLAYMMRTHDQAAIVAVNRSDEPRTLTIDISGNLPTDVRMADFLGTIGSISASEGVLSFELPALSAAVLLPEPNQDLTPPETPKSLRVEEEGDGLVTLAWDGVPDAAVYRVYRSPVRGGGYVLVGETSTNAFNDTGLSNAVDYYYVVSAVDAAGNEGGFSNEAAAIPHYTIGWANLQWPPALSHTISALNRTENVYGQVWIDGVTNQPGATPTLQAQLGYGPEGSDPAGNPDWTWVVAGFNVDAGNNDEFVASLLPESTGTFDYLYRYSTTNGRDWLYADLNGPVPQGGLPPNPGKLTVLPGSDTTPPSVPENLQVLSASPAGITLAWGPSTDDTEVFGYEIARSLSSGGPYSILGRVAGTEYTDFDLLANQTYYYVVRAVDTSFNRSEFSEEISAVAAVRSVSVTFNASVPAGTVGPVYIAGTLDRLDGDLPQWDPGGVALTQEGDTLWSITLTGREGTQLEYKYTLGSWDFVEKGAACEETANRTLLLDYGDDGQQVVNDVVQNWRNVAPCGN